MTFENFIEENPGILELDVESIAKLFWNNGIEAFIEKQVELGEKRVSMEDAKREVKV